MNKIFVAALAVSLLFVSSTVMAQVGDSHFRAWDKHEGKRTVKSSSKVKRTKKKVRVVSRKNSIQARLSPAIAKTQLAKLVGKVEAVSTSIATPFGVAVGTVSSMAGVPNEIAGFLKIVASECGNVRVISTFRKGARVAGSGRPSCHATGQAVDYQIANPSCALRLAQGVRLGHSTDYSRVAHFHVSNCQRELGVRFAHGGGKTRYAGRKSTKRYAKRSTRKAVRFAQARSR